MPLSSSFLKQSKHIDIGRDIAALVDVIWDWVNIGINFHFIFVRELKVHPPSKEDQNLKERDYLIFQFSSRGRFSLLMCEDTMPAHLCQ